MTSLAMSHIDDEIFFRIYTDFITSVQPGNYNLSHVLSGRSDQY